MPLSQTRKAKPPLGSLHVARFNTRRPTMAKKAKNRKRHKPQPPRESRSVEFLTVAWMLSVITTLLCEVGGTLAKIFGENNVRLSLFAGYLLFAAAVIGAASLVMLVAVYRLRKVKPPSGIIFFSAVVGGTPLVVLLFSWLQEPG